MTTATLSRTDRRVDRNARLAQKLTDMTGGEVKLETGGYDTDEPDSRGHLFIGGIEGDPLATEGDEPILVTQICLDDRRGDLAHQLILELRRIAHHYTALADKVAWESLPGR